MFDAVAAKYDVTNDILALGQTRRWRSEVRKALKLEPGQLVLDIAAGTGTSTAAFTTTGVTAVALGNNNAAGAVLVGNVGPTDAIITFTQANVTATSGAGILTIAYMVRESDGSAFPSAQQQ